MTKRSKEGSNYPTDWDEISARIKNDADGKCIRCGHIHDPQSGYTLTVHHLDLDPSNNAWWNLPPLCQRCHLTIQGKVVINQRYMFVHSDWFKPYIAGYYASLLGLPDTREYITEHLEEILDSGMTGNDV